MDNTTPSQPVPNLSKPPVSFSIAHVIGICLVTMLISAGAAIALYRLVAEPRITPKIETPITEKSQPVEQITNMQTMNDIEVQKAKVNPPEPTDTSSTMGTVYLTDISPSEGSNGQSITILGGGFSKTANTVIIQKQQNNPCPISYEITNVPSTDGTSLSITFPTQFVQKDCGGNNGGKGQQVLPEKGEYEIYVKNEFGTSYNKALPPFIFTLKD